MEVCSNVSTIKIDQRLQEPEVVHSAKDRGISNSNSAGTATGHHCAECAVPLRLWLFKLSVLTLSIPSRLLEGLALQSATLAGTLV